MLRLRPSLLAAAFATAFLGCRGGDKTPPPAPSAVAPSVPAPPTLAAELGVARPAELWSALRPYLGAAAQLLPGAPELALGSRLGLPPTAAALLQFAAPLVGAVAIDEAEPSVVLGVRLKSGPEFLAALSTGNAPSHRVEAAGELRLLRPASGATTDTSALAVLDDTLLIGSRTQLSKLGPYVARTLARKRHTGPAKLTIGQNALKSAVLPHLRRIWDAQRAELATRRQELERAQGKAADYADPDAVLNGLSSGVEALISSLEAAREVTLEITPEASRLVVDVAVQPAVPAASPVGGADVPLAPLFALHDQVTVGALVGRDPNTPNADYERSLGALFGERMAAADAAAVSSALRLLQTGRGRSQVFGASLDGTFLWRADVVDREKLQQGVDDMLALVVREPFAAPLTQHFGVPRLRRRDGSSRGSGPRSATVTFAPNAAARQAGRTELAINVVWRVDESSFALASGKSPTSALETTLASPSTGIGGGTPAALLSPVDAAHLAGFINLAALGFGRSPQNAWLAFAVSEPKGAVRVRIAATPSALPLFLGALL